MILIPGLASSGETWTTTVAHLRERYTCHVLTLAGFAGVPPIAEPLVPTATAEIARYIAAAKLDHPVIVGHSLGGDVALALGSEHPAAIGPLVIVDSLPFPGSMVGAGSVDQAKPTIAQIRTGMNAQTAEQHEAQTRAGTMTRAMVTSDADHARIIAWGLASDRATVTEAFLGMLGTDLRPQLSAITVPALVIGTWSGWTSNPADRATSIQTFHDQYATLPRMHFVMAEVRHFVMFDDLPWFLAQLDGFLANPEAAVRDRGFPAG